MDYPGLVWISRDQRQRGSALLIMDQYGLASIKMDQRYRGLAWINGSVDQHGLSWVSMDQGGSAVSWISSSTTRTSQEDLFHEQHGLTSPGNTCSTHLLPQVSRIAKPIGRRYRASHVRLRGPPHEAATCLERKNMDENYRELAWGIVDQCGLAWTRGSMDYRGLEWISRDQCELD